MSKLTVKELSVFVLEFLEQAAPQMKCIYIDPDGDSEQLDENGNIIPLFLSVDDTLAMWMQLPDCSYSLMFIGWLLAKGININQHSPSDLEKAVCTALTGGEKNVMFDWFGDADASQKLN